jgi:anti-sigma factor RsiW
MKHKKLQIIVSAYIDGEAADEEKAVARQHIEACAECRAFADRSELIRESIRTSEEYKFGEGFVHRVTGSIAIREEQTMEWIGVERLARNMVMMIAVLIAALLLLTTPESNASPNITEVLIDGTGSDSAAAQVLLKPGNLSKNDLLYAVITK